LKVSHILTRPLTTIAGDNTILAAAKLMVKNNIGLLVVTHSDGKLAGVISERDIIRVGAEGGSLETSINEICTKNVVTVGANADVAEAAKAMNKHRIRHVVVVDEAQKPVGVVSMRDLVGERATLTAILQSNEKEIFHGAD
jgi:CBS domain-containing protein